MWNTDMLSLLLVQNISRVNWSSVSPSYYLDKVSLHSVLSTAFCTHNPLTAVSQLCDPLPSQFFTSARMLSFLYQNQTVLDWISLYFVILWIMSDSWETQTKLEELSLTCVPIPTKELGRTKLSHSIPTVWQ